MADTFIKRQIVEERTTVRERERVGKKKEKKRGEKEKEMDRDTVREAYGQTDGIIIGRKKNYKDVSREREGRRERQGERERK